MTSRHIYVDETKSAGYVLVATALYGSDVDRARKVIREMVLPGQGRIHMAKESPRRRKEIIGAICDLNPQAVVYDAARRYNNAVARVNCLQAVVDDFASDGEVLMVLEADDSLIRSDRRHLIDMVRSAGCVDRFRYQHCRARSELMLGFPDAIAWCWARGGPWREMIRPITTVRSV